MMEQQKRVEQRDGRTKGTECAKAWRCETSGVAGVSGGLKGMEVMKLKSIKGSLIAVWSWTEAHR